jgi:predicted GTPase
LPRRAVIMGAAGRDFHNFNIFFRDNPLYKVVAFTASQLPVTANRTYPESMAGEQYPNGIPIYAEDQLDNVIQSEGVTDVFFSYSDTSYDYVMHRASIAQARGATFHLLGPSDTMIKANKPVIAVVAVRTGAGKSTISRKVSDILIKRGLRPVVVRHPMPYNEVFSAVQRFEHPEDLDRYHVTVEEREEYEGHLSRNLVVFAGVDYKAILMQAEKEGDVIIWDGGNNDWSFYRPDVSVVVADPLRQGHESRYYPGETNVRMADIIVVNKVNVAPKDDVERTVQSCSKLNPRAKLVKTRSEAVLDHPDWVRGKRVLVVEDGPSVTHGELAYGAGTVAARTVDAVLVDPRTGAVGAIRAAYEKYPTLGSVLPALGYSDTQLMELEESINAVNCDAVVLGTPADLTKLIRIGKPVARVAFEAYDEGRPTLEELLAEKVASFKQAAMATKSSSSSSSPFP